MKCCQCELPAKEGRTRCPDHLALANERTKQYRARHPEKARAAVANWAKANKERLSVYTKRWRATWSPERKAKERAKVKAFRQRNKARLNEQQRKAYWSNPEKYRKASRASNYGISVAELDSWLSRTHCGICERGFGTGESMQHLDHDHSTGKIRDVLCHRCNTMLGKLEESRALIAKFDAYLARHQAKEVA